MSSPTIDPSSVSHQPAPIESLRRALIAVIDRWYCDRRRNVSRPKLLFTVAVADTAAVFLSGLAVQVLFSGAISWSFIAIAASMALATSGLLHRYWSYTVHALRNTSAQIGKVAAASPIVFLMAAGIAYVGELPMPAPSALIVWLSLAMALTMLTRVGTAGVLRTLTAEGRLVRRTVIVGGGPDCEALITTLARDEVQEIQILGVFDDRFDERSSDEVAGYPKLGNFEQLSQFCRLYGVELLIVTVPLKAEQRLMQILQKLFTLAVDVRISALTSTLRLNSGAYSYIGSVPMLAIMDKPLTDWDRVLKNIEDRVLAALLLLLAAPVMVAVAIAVRLDSKGPVFFRQRRFGFNNELIEVWKFRSLKVEQQDAKAAKLVTKDDPRVTRVGRFIRKTSLDELPQLVNVLMGSMSLVGPRPHATEAKAESDLYETVVQGYFARHRMKPGVTGWAQINGWRGETDTHEKIKRRVEADLYYIDHWSVLFDLYIIAMTPIALLTGKNAY